MSAAGYGPRSVIVWCYIACDDCGEGPIGDDIHRWSDRQSCVAQTEADSLLRCLHGETG
jgi:hypothetical protein